MHHADAGLQRIKGGVELHFFSVDQDIPLIAARLTDHVHAKQYFHQGTLSGAVFAHQTQHLALFQGEVDVCEHLIAEKPFLIFRISSSGALFFSIFIPTYSSEEGGCPPSPL